MQVFRLADRADSVLSKPPPERFRKIWILPPANEQRNIAGTRGLRKRIVIDGIGDREDGAVDSPCSPHGICDFLADTDSHGPPRKKGIPRIIRLGMSHPLNKIHDGDAVPNWYGIPIKTGSKKHIGISRIPFRIRSGVRLEPWITFVETGSRRKVNASLVIQGVTNMAEIVPDLEVPSGKPEKIPIKKDNVFFVARHLKYKSRVRGQHGNASLARLSSIPAIT